MSTILDQADDLRKQAISILVTERTAIDERLALLGYDGAAPVTRQKACRVCGDTAHNARTCPNKKAGTEVPATQST
jgi:hypothetical protein